MSDQTEFESIVASVSKEFDTVQSAPIPFAVITFLVFLIAWRVYDQLYRRQIISLEALIALRNSQLDDYKDKLSGATPDEAKARIDRLEQQLKTIYPRGVIAAGEWFMLPPGIAMLWLDGFGTISVEIESRDGTTRTSELIQVNGAAMPTYPFRPGDRRARISATGSASAEIA